MHPGGTSIREAEFACGRGVTGRTGRDSVTDLSVSCRSCISVSFATILVLAFLRFPSLFFALLPYQEFVGGVDLRLQLYFLRTDSVIETCDESAKSSCTHQDPGRNLRPRHWHRSQPALPRDAWQPTLSSFVSASLSRGTCPFCSFSTSNDSWSVTPRDGVTGGASVGDWTNDCFGCVSVCGCVNACDG